LGIASLAPDFVRIYPTVVLAGTELAQWYQAARFTPMPLEDCVDLVKRLYLLFCQHGIQVVRMGLQATEALDGGKGVIAGPYHPAFGHMVHSKIFFDRAVSAIRELTSAGCLPPHRVLLHICPSDESRMRGLKGGNVAALRDSFPGLEIRIVADAALIPGTLNVSVSDGR
jgi:histone acetyltransferase (RNA polymerase elongator complex component)